MPKGIRIVASEANLLIADNIAKELHGQYDDVQVVRHSPEIVASLDGMIVLLDSSAERNSGGLLKGLKAMEVPVILLTPQSAWEREKRHINADIVGRYVLGVENVQEYVAIIDKIMECYDEK